MVGALDDGINLETDDVVTAFTYTTGSGDLPKGLLLTVTDGVRSVNRSVIQLRRGAELGYSLTGGSASSSAFQMSGRN